jgi:hypothetical protein
MKLILATGSDLNYMTKMRPYLKSIEQNSNFDKNVLVFVGDGEGLSIPFKSVEIATLPISNIQSLNMNKCVQHGDFLNSEYFNSITEDDDIIFYTDGDIILQRNLSDEEIEFYKSFKNGDVYVGYNASPTDTLEDEANKLGKTGMVSPHIEIGVWSTTKVYNTGVLAMNKRTWKMLLSMYNTLYPNVEPMFMHYAKQQWLISYIIGVNEEFNVIEMGYDIHNHLHYPSPEGTTQDGNGDVFFNNKKVIFKHKW